MQTIHRIAVPNPFFEGRNSVYLLLGDPLTLIDTGVATDKAYEHLVAGLNSLGVSPSDVKRVLLTHKHIDHIGNAWRLHKKSNAEIFIHELEQKSLTDVDPSGERFREVVKTRMANWEIPEAESKKSFGTKMPQWRLESCKVKPLPERLPFCPRDGEERNIDVIHTPGHSMGSVCFRLDDVLFSGDHVLERISPNIGGGDLRSRGLLAQFLDSLERVKRLGDLHIHPGHDKPFYGLVERCDRLTKHHNIRLKQALRAVQNGRSSVYDISSALYGELKDFHIMLGCAEANAHLEYLADKGEITERDGKYFPMS